MRTAMNETMWNNIGLCFVILTIIYGVESIDKKGIVDLHNAIRQKIREGSVPGQPKGINLVDMQWDEKLAKKALNHAKHCIFQHDGITDSRFYHVGQNIYVTGNTDRKSRQIWKEAINSWYNEYKYYRYSNQFSAATGHYTQLVWSNTKYVGCGYAYCSEKTPYQNYYVCNYGPGGNIIGQYPYKTG